MNKLLAKSTDLEVTDANLQSLSRIIMKMPQKSDPANVNKVVSALFEIASTKLCNDSDKAVLYGLQAYIQQVEIELLMPKPRYIDAFFFPNEKNIDKLVSYLNKAEKSLKICVFTITNDKLANAINDAW